MLTFDVNDFDEAYVGHFSWDLRRFVASVALMGWQKALPEDALRELAGDYLRAYTEQVAVYVEEEKDDAHALNLEHRGGTHPRRPAHGRARRPGSRCSSA